MNRFLNRLLAVAGLICLAANAHCQLSAADSVQRALQTAKDDTGKVLLLFAAGIPLEDAHPDSALQLYRQAFLLSRQLHYSTGLFKYYSYASGVHDAQGKYRQALEENKAGIDYARSTGNKYWLLINYANLANCFLFMEKWDSAVAWYNKAIPAFEASADTPHLALCYSNITEAYRKTGQLQKALDAALAAANLSMPHDPVTYANATANAANILEDMQRYEEALTYYNKAELLATQAGDEYLLANILFGYCDFYKDTKNLPGILAYARRLHVLTSKLNNHTLMLRSDYDMAYGFFTNDHFDSARYYAVQNIAAAKADSNASLLANDYWLMALIQLAQSRDVAGFMTWSRKSDSMGKLVRETLILHNTQELQEQYETNKKETQIHLQMAELRARRLQNVILLAVLTGLFIIVILAFAFYRKRQQLQQNRITMLEAEKQLSATQAVLQGQDEERTRLAKDLHDGLGGMLSGIKFSFGHMRDHLALTDNNRQSFERSMDMLDSSIKELRRVAHNMMPESLLKFGLDAAVGDLCSYLHQPDGMQVSYQSIGLADVIVDKNMAVNIYRIIQELLQNALKHARAAQVIVQVTLRDGRFSITVEDNGKGFDSSLLSQSQGIGWSNIRNRVRYLNGTLDVRSLPENGTSVLIECTMQAA